MSTIWDSLITAVGNAVPNIILAVIILLIGWLLAWLIARAVRFLMRKSGLGVRLAGKVEAKDQARVTAIDDGVAKIVFWVLMIFVFVAALEVLGLQLIATPLSNMLNDFLAYIPNLLGALILTLLAWGLASLLRMIVTAALTRTTLDSRVGGELAADQGPKPVPVGRTIGEAVYWLVFLLFLPAILGTLNLGGLLIPVQNMLNEILLFLPNLLAAAIIALVAWFVARIVRRILTSLLVAVGLDRLGDRLGAAKVLGRQTLSGLIGLVAYILILIPGVIAALDALKLNAITLPAISMLARFLNALPAIFAAAVVVIIAYIVGRLVANLVAALLANIGFDGVLVRLRLSTSQPDGRWTPSKIVGNVVLVAILLVGVVQAFTLLGFPALVTLTAGFLVFAGHVLLGLVIFALGLLLSEAVARAVKGSSMANAGLVATGTRAVILLLAGAMALTQMGVANQIIVVGFALLLGSVAVAVAVAFGVGGRGVAGEELRSWVQALKEKK